MTAVQSLPELAGKLPDAEVAALTDSSVNQVLAYRRAHSIQPYVRSPPVSSARLPAEPVPGPSEGTASAPAATAGSAGEPAAPGRRGGRKPTAEGRLAPFLDLMGTVSDSEIAERAGLSQGAVGAIRRKLGLPAYKGFLWAKGHKPVGGRGRRGAPQVRGKMANIEKFAALVGTVPDAVVAEKAGVSRSSVTAWRRQRGIEAAQRPREQAVDPAPAERVAAEVPTTAAVREALAFTVVAVRRELQATFIVVGTDIAVAARRALTALGARTDGPWRLDELRHLGDAIEQEGE